MSDGRLRNPVTVLVPTGALGAGVVENEVAYGIARGAEVIAADAGSTDSGAAYLALGVAKYNRGAVRRDLEILIRLAWPRRIPILVGTSGQAGADANVDWLREIAVEIADELGIAPRIACLHSEISGARLKRFIREGRVAPLAPARPLKSADVDACDRIVAVLGPEPYIAALRAGADIVLGGRTSDPAVIAAFPIMKGAGLAASWHAGKIAECGGLSSDSHKPGSGVLVGVGADGFTIEPLDLAARCSVRSVSAHMAYENANPFRLTEPGGVLDVTCARYEQRGERMVSVHGAKWTPQPYTLRIEGAGARQFQTIMLIGIQDPLVLGDPEAFHDRMHAALVRRVEETMGPEAGEFDISLRLYGWNAVSGEQVSQGTPSPREIGVLFIATARTQLLATQIAKACNPVFFHLAMPGHSEMPSYAFPFSPAYVPRGPVFEFLLNHVVTVGDPMELVRFQWTRPGFAETGQ